MTMQTGPLADLYRRVASLEQIQAAARPVGFRQPNQFALAKVVSRRTPDADELGSGLAAGVDFWDVIPLDFMQVDGEPPEVSERQADPIRARVGNQVELHAGELVGMSLGTDAVWWIVARIAKSPGQPPDACCSCPPTDCSHDIFAEHAEYMIVDFGELACCGGRAGGVHNLRWNGYAWSTPIFYCDPFDESTPGEGGCGTADWVWRDYAMNCGRDSATFQWNPGAPPFCLGSWSQLNACPDGCSAEPPPAGMEYFFLTGLSPCDSHFVDKPCLGPSDTPTPGWELVASDCSCGESPTPPTEDGTVDGQTATTNCPGTPPNPTDPECDPDAETGIVYEGNDYDIVGSYFGKPGYVIWSLGQTSCLNYQYFYGDDANQCDNLEAAWATRPSVPGHSNNVPWQLYGTAPAVPFYVVIRCPDEACPADGKVRLRWVLVPPTGYEEARLELRELGYGVRIRYRMAPGVRFCEKCLNRMQVESLAECDWPCEGIPELVCVRPSMTKEGQVTCVPYAKSYSFTCPTVTSTDSIFGANSDYGGPWDSADLTLAAGTYVLDLKGNAGADPEISRNGCGRFDVKCCTWIAPRSGITDTDLQCDHLGELRWAMQTCSIRNEDGATAYLHHQMYDCSDDHVPVLRYGSSAYPSLHPDNGVRVGPAMIRWSFFGGPAFASNGQWPDEGVDNGCGVYGGVGSCCVTSQACGPTGGNPIDNSVVFQKSFCIEWIMAEKLSDGTLRMVNSDGNAALHGFPSEILLTPQD